MCVGGRRRELAWSQRCVRTQDPPPAVVQQSSQGVQKGTRGGGQGQDGATQGSCLLADPLHPGVLGTWGWGVTVALRPPAEMPQTT